MRLSGGALCASVVGLSVLGCGGGAKQAPLAVSPAPSASASAAPAPSIAAALDLSEVPDPADLLGIVRVRNLEALTGIIEKWTGIPVAPRDLIGRLDPSLLAPVLALDAPIDVVVALNPSARSLQGAPLAVASFGLRSLEEATDAARSFGKVREIAPGVFRIPTARPHLSCVIAAAAGTPPARLVCGDQRADLDGLLSFAVRTLPRRQFASDFHAEVHLAPLERRFGPFVRQALSLGAAMLAQSAETGDPELDRASMMAGEAVAEEISALFGDTDTLSLDASVQQNEATVEGALRLRDGQSWTVQAMRDMSRGAAAAPAPFLRLPGDATAVEFWQRLGSNRFAAVRRGLVNLLVAGLAHAKVPKADRAAASEFVDQLLALDTADVAAIGPWKAAGDGGRLAPSWAVLGALAPPDRTLPLVRKLVALSGRPALQGWVKRAFEQLELSGAVLAPWRSMPAPKQLPAGTLAFVSSWTFLSRSPAEPPSPLAGSPAAGRIPGSSGGDSGSSSGRAKVAKAGTAKGKAKGKAPNNTKASIPFYLLVVPTPEVTWLGIGADRDAVVRELGPAARPEDSTPTVGVAAASAIERLKTDRLLAGGYVTLRALVEQMYASGPPGDLGPADNALARLDGLPHQGRTPMVFTFRPLDASDGTTSIELHVPREAIEDATALALRLMVLGAPASSGPHSGTWGGGTP